MPASERLTPAELLRIYDAEVRGSFRDRLPEGWSAEQDGPVTRCLTPHDGFAMFTTDPSGLDGRELSGVVDRTFAYYEAEGTGFEWKTFDHERADLVPLLLARGAKPDPHEALVLGEAVPLAVAAPLPAGLEIVRVVDRVGLAAIAAMESEVWADDWSWLADDLESRLRGSAPIEVFAVWDGERVVSAAWLVPAPGTRVAGLWGGSTLAAYRGRGVYRALVAHRARRAVELGYSILQVDASDDSRPILERLGLQVVGGTTPYVVEAPAA